MPKHPADFKLELLLLAAVLAIVLLLLAILAWVEGRWDEFGKSALGVIAGTAAVYIGLLIFERD